MFTRVTMTQSQQLSRYNNTDNMQTGTTTTDHNTKEGTTTLMLCKRLMGTTTTDHNTKGRATTTINMQIGNNNGHNKHNNDQKTNKEGTTISIQMAMCARCAALGTCQRRLGRISERCASRRCDRAVGEFDAWPRRFAPDIRCGGTAPPVV